MRLECFPPNEVAVVLWAVTRLQGKPDKAFVAAALRHCFTQARQLSPTGLSMLMWCLGSLTWNPPESWVAKLLVVTQV